jgi:hypothetical protein
VFNRQQTYLLGESRQLKVLPILPNPAIEGTNLSVFCMLSTDDCNDTLVSNELVV